MADFFSLLREKIDRRYQPLAGDPHQVPTDRRSILSRWRDLKGLKTIEPQQLAPLVDIKENRELTLRFKGEDAAIVINAIDQVLQRVHDQEKTRLYAFKVLRKLAGKTCRVPKSYLIGRWTRYKVKEEIIACGGFADIREGRLGNKGVAVKTVRVSREMDINLIHKSFCKEIVLWMNLNHPNILPLIAVEMKPRVKKFSMITEMMGNGNIMNYIRTNKADRLSLLKDVANGLRYLHGLGIVHGDIKGPNILVNDGTPPQACIADFGFCAIAPWMSFDPTTHKDHVGGTWGYMAPELFYTGAKRTREADIYAFGVVVYEVVTGERFHGRRRLEETLILSRSGTRPERPEGTVASSFGQGTWGLIERCWNVNSKKRPLAGEVQEHFERVAAISQPVDPTPAQPAQGVNDESTSTMELTSAMDNSRGISATLLLQPSYRVND